MDRNEALDRVLRALALGVPPHLDVVEAAGLQGHAGLLNEIADRSQRMEKALRRIAEATDLYEPCGWAVHSARAALSPVAPDQGEG